MLERVYLPNGHVPLGYDKSNPNHGWRVLGGGLAGNSWARVVNRDETEESQDGESDG